MQVGSVQVPVTDGEGHVQVNFDSAFSSIPKVVVNQKTYNPDYECVAARDISTVGFHLYIKCRDKRNITGYVDWVAVS